MMHPNGMLRLPSLLEMTGVSRSTIYVWMAQGRFPLSVKLGSRVVAWRYSEVLEWINACAGSSGPHIP